MTDTPHRAASEALSASHTAQIRKGPKPKWCPIYDASGLLLGVCEESDLIRCTLVPAVGRPATQPRSRKAFQ
jgi:hypothetical protein